MRLLGLSLGLCTLFAGPLGAAEPAPPTKPIQVPYRLTDTNHLLVRVKVNGKGPFNLILDTGAPALFLSTEVCKKLGIEPDKNGWGTFERFEIEGGASVPKARGRIEDPFQLKGMNGMGLAGVQLHGILGYNVLARFRLEIDLTKDKMAWTPLDFEPPAPKGIGSGTGPAGLEAMGNMMRMLSGLLGIKPRPDPVPRGFLGLRLVDAKEAAKVDAVLADSPAARAGLKVGDRIVRFQDRDVLSVSDIHRRALKLTGGEEVKLKVESDGTERDVTLRAGEGL